MNVKDSTGKAQRMFSVDSISDGLARLVSQDGEITYVPAKSLPCGLREGDMIRFDGEKPAVDRQMTDRIRCKNKSRQERLASLLGAGRTPDAENKIHEKTQDKKA